MRVHRVFSSVARLRSLVLRSAFALALVPYCGAAYLPQQDEGPDPTFSADILSTTTNMAYDGTERDRTTIGIGETVDLWIDTSSYKDMDRCQTFDTDPWRPFEDRLGGVVWSIKSGSGHFSYSGDSAEFTAFKMGQDSTTVIEVVLKDTGATDADQDIDITREKTFEIVVPDGVDFSPPAFDPGWLTDGRPVGPPDIWLQAHVFRNFKVTQRDVYFATMFSEAISAHTWVWNRGDEIDRDAYVGFQGINAIDPFTKLPVGAFGDNHVASGKYVYLDLRAQSTITSPGAYGWQLESGLYYRPITWIHEFYVSVAGEMTLVGNGHTSTAQGPFPN